MPTQPSDPAPSDTAPGTPPRAGRGTWLVLCAVIALAFGLRLQGLGFLLPHLGEPDGLVIDYQVRALESAEPERRLHPLFAYYPHLVARTATLVPAACVAPSAPQTLDEHLRAASATRLRARLAVALLSLLALPVTWWLARRFLPDPWPLAAAAFAGSSLLTLWFAQQARPHAAAAALAVLAVGAAVRLRERGGWAGYVMAGLGAGLAVGALQSGLAVLPALLVAALLRWRADRWRSLVGAGLAFVVAAVCVPVLYPFLFVRAEHGAKLQDGGGTLALSHHRVFLDLFNGRGFATVWRSLAEYDPLLTGLALLGLVTAGVLLVTRARALGTRRAGDLVIVLAHALPYLVAIGLYQRTYQRFALPLVPYLSILAALGLWGAYRLARRAGRPARTLAATLALACVGAQLAWAWRLGDLRSRGDTIEEAADWIAANAEPAADRIDVMPGIDLPLAQTPAALQSSWAFRGEESMPWFRYQAELLPGTIDAPRHDLRLMELVTFAERQAAHADAYAFARRLTGRFAVVISWPPRQRDALRAVREGLRGQFPLVARFAPDEPDVGEDLPLAHQDDEYPYTLPWAARILSARRVGPAIEIYQLR